MSCMTHMYLLLSLFKLLGGRRLTGGRKLLKMRRGSGHNSSFRPNRSFKLKRGQEGSGGGGGGSEYSDIVPFTAFIADCFLFW